MQPTIKTTKYLTGQLESQISYVNGEIHGMELWRYKNGQLRYELPYVHGKRHGIAKYWHENGQLSSQVLFVNDKRHGTALWCYNGQLYSMNLYRSNIPLIEIKFSTPQNSIPTRTPLFSKSQFKTLCQ